MNILIRNEEGDLDPVQASLYMKFKLALLAMFGLGGIYVLINEDETPDLELYDEF